MATASPKQLSQRDIDALLKGAQQQDAPAPAAAASLVSKPYDFRKPDKFSKDHLRALQVIFETYARNLSGELSAMLRTQVIVRLSSVEQTTYEEYTAQLPNPAAIAIVNLQPLPDRIIFEVSLPLVDAMFDRLLGGLGRAAQRQREITEIESSILRLIMQRMLPTMGDAWSGVGDVLPVLEDTVFSPVYIPAAVPGTAAALVVLESAIGDITGTLSIAIPYTVLEPVMGKLSTQKWLATPRQTTGDPDAAVSPFRPLRQASVPLTVVLGQVTASLGELLYLNEGDILRLDTTPGDELTVLVNGHAKFHGLPGKLGAQAAVQISRVIDEEEA